ncbi:MAG TPA: class I SAM-dependent methyltransferase [Verrucomicrobiae bacterium]|nr:class I SAM-dependent methyltransferase [Verrucomicrobiae bacterium]
MKNGSDRFHNLRNWLKARLSPESRVRLHRWLDEPMAFLVRRDLPKLAVISGTDKWGAHWYAEHYARHFQHLRRERITLLEIGIGGYEIPRDGGGSLRMWRRYFPNGQIVGLDYFDKSPHAEKRIRIYRGDQSDEKLLRQIVAEVGPPDIVIDDGSHLNRHVIKSFEVLFPLMAENGIYVVEDTQTAYWPDAGGNSDNLLTASTSMGLFKSLVDGLNYEEFLKPGYTPSYYDLHITGMHFYHNMVFIQKGRNQEGSNIVRNPSLPAEAKVRSNI